MRAFNLDAAKAGAKLVTRGGRNARFIGHVPEASKGYRVIVYVSGSSAVSDYCENGKSDDKDRESDLFLADEVPA